MKLNIPYLYLLAFCLFACTPDQKEQEQGSNELPEAQAIAADFEESLYKWGYINKRGRLVIEAIYDECKNFNDGLAVARKKDKWGYIDKSGRIAIPLQFQEVYDFSDSMAVVKHYGKKYEVINHKGDPILSKTYDEIKNFTEGFAAAKDNNNWTYIDYSGKELIAPMFTKAYPFKNGLAKVKLAGKYGIIDTNMEFIIEPELDYIADLAHLPILVKKDGIQWYINKQGKNILESKHEKAYPFKSGFAPFKDQGKMGIIDDSNNIIIPARYTDIQVMGPEQFQYFEVEKFGMLGKNGEQLIPPIMDLILPIEENKTACMKDELWAFYTSSGEQLSDFEYDLIWSFKEGLARVAFLSGVGFMNHEGKLVINPDFADVNDFSEGLARVQLYE